MRQPRDERPARPRRRRPCRTRPAQQPSRTPCAIRRGRREPRPLSAWVCAMTDAGCEPNKINPRQRAQSSPNVKSTASALTIWTLKLETTHTVKRRTDAHQRPRRVLSLGDRKAAAQPSRVRTAAGRPRREPRATCSGLSFANPEAEAIGCRDWPGVMRLLDQLKRASGGGSVVR
jgi:hypothetical protein